jgi:hypothetical protein
VRTETATHEKAATWANVPGPEVYLQGRGRSPEHAALDDAFPAAAEQWRPVLDMEGRHIGEVDAPTEGPPHTMTYRFKQFYIPDRMMLGLTRYVEHGTLPGDFLRAVICNNLQLAVGHADDENMANLPAFVGWLYNEAPGGCWGSREKMIAWHEQMTAESPKVPL